MQGHHSGIGWLVGRQILGPLTVIGALSLLDHGSGILCRPNCDNVTPSQAIQAAFKDLILS